MFSYSGRPGIGPGSQSGSSVLSTEVWDASGPGTTIQDPDNRTVDTGRGMIRLIWFARFKPQNRSCWIPL